MNKRILLSILAICLCASTALATGNPSDKYKKNVSYPSGPSYTVPKINDYSTQQATNSNPQKAQLDSIAMSMLRAAENHQDIRKYQKQFMQKGVTGICPPQIHQKRTPKCPPIRLEVNGRKMSGSKCAYTCYEYNGKKYDVGYCK